ncbi:hypothetical protein DPMN_021594 [Dreissena polymorpha]|uniref:Uncharacterized protein n=1 Tax=Dreissena polymorpha TaxID=45954 RepID=A0A9D4SA33_DREPO|nr:hypothetical protein DPMN_021594 [Dreissena polymorpha]
MGKGLKQFNRQDFLSLTKHMIKLSSSEIITSVLYFYCCSTASMWVIMCALMLLLWLNRLLQTEHWKGFSPV